MSFHKLVISKYLTFFLDSLLSLSHEIQLITFLPYTFDQSKVLTQEAIAMQLWPTLLLFTHLVVLGWMDSGLEVAAAASSRFPHGTDSKAGSSNKFRWNVLTPRIHDNIPPSFSIFQQRLRRGEDSGRVQVCRNRLSEAINAECRRAARLGILPSTEQIAQQIRPLFANAVDECCKTPCAREQMWKYCHHYDDRGR
jgi:hypothetical protein